MKYIIQVALDKAVAAKRGLFNLYDWHQEAWKLFPGKPRDKRDFLTRLDVDEREFRLTVVSDSKPQKPNWYPEGCYQNKEIPASFFEHKRYLFQLTVNPTRTLSGRDQKGNVKKHGSHYAVLKLEELRDWFKQKEVQGGFNVLEKQVLEISKPIFHKLFTKEHEGVLVGVEFKGVLEVINRDNFLKTVHNGIGRARGFGFGLFILKPIA